MRYDLALQRVLKQTGVSQAELARRCELTPGYVSQLMSGAREPGPGTLRAIAKATGVPESLFGLFGAEAEDLRRITPETAGELATHLLAALMAKTEQK